MRFNKNIYINYNYNVDYFYILSSILKNPLLFTIFILFSFSSCMKDDMRPIEEFYNKNNGVFIICEGNFMYGNASLSYYDNIKNNVENAVFLKANGIPLGDVAQSLTIHDSIAYIMINNSGKIYAININTFKYKGEISGLTSPRYMKILNPSKAYVTDMYSKCIYVINPQTYSITNIIDIGIDSRPYYRHSSEEIVISGDYAFINSWSYDDKILIINTKTDLLIDSVEVFKQPKKIVLDKNKKLWVLCDGGFQGSPYFGERGIIKINTETFEIEQKFLFQENNTLTDLKINKTGDTIYYINTHIYRYHVDENVMPSQEYINSEGKNFYGIGIDPYNSDLYVSDAIDHMQSGVVYRYDSRKNYIDHFEVGIIPNSFVFK